METPRAPTDLCVDHLLDDRITTLFIVAKVQTESKDRRNSNKSCQLWTHDSIEELRGCFEATNWDVFTDNCSDPDELVDTVTSYVKFCEETVIKTKSVHVYPNNKP